VNDRAKIIASAKRYAYGPRYELVPYAAILLRTCPMFSRDRHPKPAVYLGSRTTDAIAEIEGNYDSAEYERQFKGEC
jgi:hypothetical protein